MDEEQFRRVSKAVGDHARMEALQLLAARGEVSCSDLCEHLKLTPATISHHAQALSETGLVRQRREGKFTMLSLDRKVWRAFLRELARRIPPQ